MSVILEAIKFNHDPTSADHDALNIRKNKSQFIDVPEWVQGFSLRAEDSPAAYAINEIKGNIIAIQAKFRCSDPSIQSIEICARDPSNPRAHGCLYEILRRLGITPILPPPYGNCLGEVKSKVITIPASGETGFETFELEFVWPLSAFGLGIHTVTWEWQFRLNSTEPWSSFATTHHKIYTILDLPKSPWQQNPYTSDNDQLPWTDVLDYACIWAQGFGGYDGIAGKITNRINELGPSIIRYDTERGRTNYAWPNFNCTAFLDRLNGGDGLGEKVNCTDCATFTSTFANILGCDLNQSRMGYSFQCNEIISIGYSHWAVPFGWGFSYHEVAWKAGCDINDELFDACLKVDGDNDPTNEPHVPLLPVNIKFGNTGDLLYRDRLAAPAGRPNCNPDSGTRTRRTIV